MAQVQIIFQDINQNNQIIKLLTFVGQLDETNVDEEAKKIYSIIDEMPQPNMILDFSDLEYMNSKSIGYVTDWYSKTLAKGGKVVIARPRPNILDILKVVGIAQIITIFENLEEATASFSGVQDAPEEEVIPEVQPTHQVESTPVEIIATPEVKSAPQIAPQVEATPTAVATMESPIVKKVEIMATPIATESVPVTIEATPAIITATSEPIIQPVPQVELAPKVEMTTPGVQSVPQMEVQAEITPTAVATMEPPMVEKVEIKATPVTIEATPIEIAPTPEVQAEVQPAPQPTPQIEPEVIEITAMPEVQSPAQLDPQLAPQVEMEAQSESQEVEIEDPIPQPPKNKGILAWLKNLF